MTKRILTTLMAILLLSFPAIAGPQEGHEGHDHGDHQKEAELIITPIAPQQLLAGEENNVVLFIQDKKASPVDISQFEVVHTKPVHLLIIEPSLNDYHHEHPVQSATGQYSFSFTPQTACSYKIWADVQLKRSYQHYIPMEFKGSEECNQPINQTVSLEASSQGYDFKLELDGDVKVGETVMASLNISKDGKPLDYLEPVMGAFAHMVGFYDDYETIAHIHPMGTEPTESKQRGGPTLRFHIEPQQAGYLKLFAQVQIDGKQVFAPFSVKSLLR